MKETIEELLNNLVVEKINDEDYVKLTDIKNIIDILTVEWSELDFDIQVSYCISDSDRTYGAVYEKTSVNLSEEYVKFEYDCWEYPTKITYKKDMYSESWNNYVTRAKLAYLKI